MIRPRFSSRAYRRPGIDRSRTLCGSAALVSDLHLFGGLSDQDLRSLSLSVSMQIACFDIRAVPSQFMHCDATPPSLSRPAIAAPVSIEPRATLSAPHSYYPLRDLADSWSLSHTVFEWAFRPTCLMGGCSDCMYSMPPRCKTLAR
jgi:hypothetical protein